MQIMPGLDFQCGFIPVNMASGANTGKRIKCDDCESVLVVLFKDAGSAAEAPTITLQEHNAASSGTSANLACITKAFIKSEATLDGDESWVVVNQAAAATFTSATYFTQLQAICVIEVPVSAMNVTDGYYWLSADVADVGNGAQIGGLMYIKQGLRRASE